MGSLIEIHFVHEIKEKSEKSEKWIEGQKKGKNGAKQKLYVKEE